MSRLDKTEGRLYMECLACLLGERNESIEREIELPNLDDILSTLTSYEKMKMLQLTQNVMNISCLLWETAVKEIGGIHPLEAVNFIIEQIMLYPEERKELVLEYSRDMIASFLFRAPVRPDVIMHFLSCLTDFDSCHQPFTVTFIMPLWWLLVFCEPHSADLLEISRYVWEIFDTRIEGSKDGLPELDLSTSNTHLILIKLFERLALVDLPNGSIAIWIASLRPAFEQVMANNDYSFVKLRCIAYASAFFCKLSSRFYAPPNGHRRQIFERFCDLFIPSLFKSKQALENCKEEVCHNYITGFFQLNGVEEDPFVMRFAAQLLEKFSDIKSVVEHYKSVMENNPKIKVALYEYREDTSPDSIISTICQS